MSAALAGVLAGCNAESETAANASASSKSYTSLMESSVSTASLGSGGTTAVNYYNSYITGPGIAKASTSATATVTVLLRNSSNSPISGVRVSLTSSRSASDTISPASAVTTSTGKAVFTVQSCLLGTATLSAFSGSASLNLSTPLTFEAGTASASASTFDSASTNVQYVRKTASLTLSYTIRDACGNVLESATTSGITASRTSGAGVSTGTLSTVTSAGSGVFHSTVTGTARGTPMTVTARLGSFGSLSGSALVRVLEQLPANTSLLNTGFTAADSSLVDCGQLNMCVVKQVDQYDDDNSSKGFGGGTHVGTTSASGTLMLDATADHRNYATMAEDWTPNWSDMVSYWPMDGDYTDVKSSHNGTRVDGSRSVLAGLFSTSAKVGTQSATLDGASAISVPNHADFNFGYNSFSVSLWFRLPTVSGVTMRLLSLDYGSFDAGYVVYKDANEHIGFGVGASSGRLDLATFAFTEDKFNDDRWHFFTGVVDRTGGTQTLYIDGIPRSVTIYAGTCGTPVAASNSLNISACPSINATNLSAGVNLSIGGFEHNAVSEVMTGSLDEVALWSTALSQTTISTIYERQAPTYGSVFTSRVMDAGASVNWDDFTWKSSLPFLKPLPSTSETSATYSALATNALSDNLRLYFQFEESVPYDGTANELTDSSGNGNHGVTGTGNTVFPATDPSRIGRSLRLGNNCILSAGVLGTPFAGDFTLSTWVYSQQYTGAQQILMYTGDYLNNGFRFYQTAGPVWKFSAGQHGGTVTVQSTDVRLNEWQLVTVTFESATGTARLYLNGALVGNSGSDIGTATGTFFSPIANAAVASGGCHAGYSAFVGRLDDWAIWSRKLSTSEVSQLYLRGASRNRIQIRACSSASCSGTSWRAITTSTPYRSSSEINNIDGSGAVRTGQPNLSTSALGALHTGRYFQYRVFMEADQDATVMPNVQSVLVGPQRYYAGKPSVATTVGLDLFQFTSFSQTLGAGGCAGGVGYQFSPDNSHWYRWNGTSWVAAADDPTLTATAASLTASAVSAFDTVLQGTQSTGRVYVRAYLAASGVTTCELEKLTVDGWY